MNTDLRLVKAYEAIDTRQISLLSLDIFDTLLWRQLPEPADLFLLLGKQLKQEGWLIDAVTWEMFAELRAHAETLARQEKEQAQQTMEVTLVEIYWHLCALFVPLSTEQMLAQHTKGIYEGDVSEIVALELALERSLIKPDLNIVRLIHHARRHQIPVVLVSDTYFETEQIQQLLPPSLLPDIAQFYLSSEWQLSKQEGLFKCVLKDLKLSADKILHIGDRLEYDSVPAAEEGMKTLHFPKYSRQFEEVMEREWGEESSRRAPCLDLAQGDFGLSSLRSKLLYHTDLTTLKQEEQFFWKYGATILGPFLLGFTHWLYTRCEQMHVHKVFCLMREGRLYAHLIKKFAPYYPQHTLQTEELWVSRIFMTHAAMATANREELTNAMKVLLVHFTVENFCHFLGLQVDQMGKWAQFRHVVLEDPLLRKQFIFYLVEKRELRNQIIQTAAAKREHFLTYFSQLVDLTADAQVTLVDVGWQGTAQKGLHEMLRLAQSPIKLHGLYLSTTRTAKALQKGVVCEGYLFNGAFRDNAYIKGIFVLEQTATAETGLGSLRDIREDGEVITHPFSIPPKQKKQASIVQQGIFAFFDLMGPYIRSKEIDLNSSSEPFLNQLRTQFIRSLTNATYLEASRFGSWYHEHGPASNLIQVLAKNTYYEQFIQDMLPTAAFNELGLNWLSGYAAKKCKYLTLVSQAMCLDTLPAECFLSQDAFFLRIFCDTGKDFPKKANKQVELRSNPNRNFYTVTRLCSAKKAMQRIQLMLSFPSAYVRIKSLRLLTYDKTTPEPQLLTFFESPSTQTPHCLCDKQLDFNTFYCSQNLKFIHTFNTAAIYQVHIKLCCEMFKSNPDPK